LVRLTILPLRKNMQTTPQSQKTFCGLSRENLALLASAQRRLLIRRGRSRAPRDPRSENNLKHIESLLRNGDVNA
jgi:hypothetical protein